VFWNALGVPESFDAERAPFLQCASELSCYCSVRDPLSLEALLAAGVRTQVAVTPDPRVLPVATSEGELCRTWTALLGAPPDPARPTLCLQVEGEILREQPSELCAALRAVAWQHHFRRLLLVPAGPADERMHELATRLGRGVVLLDRSVTPQEQTALVWGSDAWIGSSVQGCLKALAFHKPHLALGRSRDLRGHVELLGRPQFVLPAAADLRFSAEWLLPAVRGEVAEVHRELCRQTAHHFDRMAELLTMGCQQMARTGAESLAGCAAREWYRRARAHRRLHELIAHLEAVQQHAADLRRHYSQPHFRAAEAVHRLLCRVPLALRRLRALVKPVRPTRLVAPPEPVGEQLDRLLFLDAPLRWLCSRTFPGRCPATSIARWPTVGALRCVPNWDRGSSITG
jgi:hypothetical protein